MSAPAPGPSKCRVLPGQCYCCAATRRSSSNPFARSVESVPQGRNRSMRRSSLPSKPRSCQPRSMTAARTPSITPRARAAGDRWRSSWRRTARRRSHCEQPTQTATSGWLPRWTSSCSAYVDPQHQHSVGDTIPCPRAAFIAVLLCSRPVRQYCPPLGGALPPTATGPCGYDRASRRCRESSPSPCPPRVRVS